MIFSEGVDYKWLILTSEDLSHELYKI